MTLQSKNKQRILFTGLKQWIWNAKREYLDPWKFGKNVFGPETKETRIKCTWFHRFQAVFLAKDLLLLSASMSNINKIDYKTKESTEAHAFTPSIFSKSLTASNIAMFKDLNVDQISIKKTDF